MGGFGEVDVIWSVLECDPPGAGGEAKRSGRDLGGGDGQANNAVAIDGVVEGVGGWIRHGRWGDVGGDGLDG